MANPLSHKQRKSSLQDSTSNFQVSQPESPNNKNPKAIIKNAQLPSAAELQLSVHTVESIIKDLTLPSSAAGVSHFSQDTSLHSIIKEAPSLPDTAVGPSCFALSFMAQVEAIGRLLHDQLLVCDAKLSMFITAAHSVEYVSNLQPCPPMYQAKNTDVCIQNLIEVLETMPSLELLRKIIDQKNFVMAALDADLVELLYWLLVSTPQLSMRLLDEAEFTTVLEEVNSNSSFPIPTHVFALGARPRLTVRTIQTCKLNTRYAFYTTSLNHLYVITNCGFKPHLLIATVRVFWELSDAIEQAHPTPAWGASKCGSLIRCVVLCELAMDPKFVKTRDWGAFVQQGELLTPRFLLFYGQQAETPPPVRVAPVRIKRERYNGLISVLSISAIFIMMYLNEYYTNREILDICIWVIQRLCK